MAAQFNQHGNCTTATVDSVVLGKCQTAGMSNITVEHTSFLPCILMNKTEYNRGCCGSFTASDFKCSRSYKHILLPHLVMPLRLQNIIWGAGSGNEWETMQLTSNWPGTISSVTAAPPSMCLLSNTTTLLPALAKYAACNSYEGDEFGHWLWMA